jgi:hypothetical protein
MCDGALSTFTMSRGRPRMTASAVTTNASGPCAGGAGAKVTSPADFGNFIAEDIEKWAKVIKFANIKRE